MKLTIMTAAVLAATVAPAFADSNVSASLTGLRFELVDLNPNDGISPSVVYTGTPHVRVLDWTWCGSRDCDTFGSSFESGVMRGDGYTFAAASPAGLFSVSHAEPEGGYYTIRRSTSDLRSRGSDPLFRLSANTGIRVTGNYSVSLDAIPDTDESRTYASARLSAYSRGGYVDGGGQYISFSASSDENTTLHEHGTFSAMWRNDKDRTAGVWGGISLYAGSTVAAIPEPSTYALMIAGLGMVGFAAKRRSTKCS